MSEEIVVEKKHKAKYRSALRSIKLIKDAYIALMHEKNPDKISVSDIVKKADLNRGTFYAHYNKPSDIKNEIGDEIIEKINIVFEGFNFTDFFTNPTPFLKKTEDILSENLDYYKNIMCYTMSIDFFRKIKQILLKKIIDDASIPENIRKSPQFLIAAEFLTGGMLTLYTSYVQGTIEISDSTIADILTPIIIGSSQMLLAPSK